MSLENYSVQDKKETSYVFPLSENEKARKRVQVHKFKGKYLIDIRELYCADGEWLPGKKGISLRIEDFKKLKEVMPLIVESITALGGSLEDEE